MSLFSYHHFNILNTNIHQNDLMR